MSPAIVLAAIEVFPANLLASHFGFTRKTLFEASADERAAPNIRA